MSTSHDELYDVVDFEIVGDYKIRVVFNDDFARTIDFEPILLGPLFHPLRDLELFNGVTLDSELGTLVWTTGADIDPTVLHDWPDHVDAIVERRRQRFSMAGTARG